MQKAFTIAREQNITFRLSAFNFVNHPLTTLSTSFQNEYTLDETNPAGTAPNQGAVNQAQTGFGVLPYSTGRRIVELMLKYNF